MPRDLEGLADLVVLTVKNAIAPLKEELALVKQENSHLRASLAVVPDLRDRIVAVETKAASAVAHVAVPVEVDLAPITERLALIEQESAGLKASLTAVTELRDRVVVVETKSATAQPVAPAPVPPVDLTPLIERIAAIEHQQETVTASLETVTELRDRVVAVETKAAIPPLPTFEVDFKGGLERLAALESHLPRFALTEQQLADVRERVAVLGTKALEPQPSVAPPGLSEADVELAIRQRLDPVLADVTAVRERVIAVEARAPIPGPPGKDGQHGKDGAPGRDGVDGLGFDDMDVEFDDRTLTLKFARGSQTKTWPITLPYLGYQGVYIEGKSYDRGDVVTFAGSTWHANKETRSKPGDDSKDWTLIVKRGRDGRDGKDGGAAPPAMPVVKVR